MEKDKQRWLDQLVNNTNNNNNTPSQMQSPTKTQSRITSPGSPLFPDFQYVISPFCSSISSVSLFELTFLHHSFLSFSYPLLFVFSFFVQFSGILITMINTARVRIVLILIIYQWRVNLPIPRVEHQRRRRSWTHPGNWFPLSLYLYLYLYLSISISLSLVLYLIYYRYLYLYPSHLDILLLFCDPVHPHWLLRT